MMKFFRKVRQQLLIKNKFGNYSLYAIGEILLVVIGILIALQIDNWNEAQNLHGTEVLLLKEMKANLESDLAETQQNIILNKEKLNANTIVLENLKSPGSYNDTLNFYYANLMGGSYFSKNTSAYDNLKSFGFHIINNDSLRMMITELYSNKYAYIDLLESNFLDNFYSLRLEPLIISNIILDTMWISATPVNQSKLAMNHEFKEVVKVNISWISFMIVNYTNIEEEIVRLIHQIEGEINQL
jgi:hypothetical protein